MPARRFGSAAGSNTLADEGSIDLHIAIYQPSEGHYYHWSFVVSDLSPDSSCNWYIFEAVRRSDRSFTLEARMADPWRSRHCRGLHHVRSLRRGDLDDVMCIVQSVRVARGSKTWDCQDYVSDICRALMRSGLVDERRYMAETWPQTCLDSSAVQSASSRSGQEKGTVGINPGQSESETDEANFINFCAGQSLTNGEQNNKGSCNGIPMGRIPSATNMISTVITHPPNGGEIAANATFNVTIQTRHLRAGFLANPAASYYAAPQELDEAGDVIGHCHVTIQNIGDDLLPAAPPDAAKVVFFLGVDDAVEDDGGLRAEVHGGLRPGAYRACTMVAARNHQPVIMPVAQRGAQDDCVRFRVV